MILPALILAPLIHVHADEAHVISGRPASSYASVIHAHYPHASVPVEFDDDAEHSADCIDGILLLASDLGASSPATGSGDFHAEFPFDFDPPELSKTRTVPWEMHPYHPPPGLDSHSLRAPPA